MALRKARAAVASSPEIEATAEEVLRKGNALDAVVAGVFAAAALAPGVLLGPVQILLGGAGAGFLAIDGARQGAHVVLFFARWLTER